VHDGSAEATVVRTWVGRLCAALVPGTGCGREAAAHRAARRALAVLPEVCAALVDGVPGAVATIHRDLHDKQVLVDGDRVALLDCDTIAQGEAALDLANLLTHLELRVLQGHAPARAAAAARKALLAAYEPADGVQRRLPAYTAAAWLRLACVYAFRPCRRGLVEDLLDRVHGRERHRPSGAHALTV
jgi:aminoglycoside phosphotransferase (APT) family kinase protein